MGSSLGVPQDIPTWIQRWRKLPSASPPCWPSPTAPWQTSNQPQSRCPWRKAQAPTILPLKYSTAKPRIIPPLTMAQAQPHMPLTCPTTLAQCMATVQPHHHTEHPHHTATLLLLNMGTSPMLLHIKPTPHVAH